MTVQNADDKLTRQAVVYITGGGKCGTHLVSNYIHVNCPNTHVQLSEFKNWKEDLPELLEPGKNFVFHCPGTEVNRFRQMIPGGIAVIMLRNPIQQYLSWITALHGRIARKRSYWSARGGASAFHYSLKRVVEAFRAAAEGGSHVWRLEDFSGSANRREDLVSSILPIADSPTDDIPLPKKTNYLNQERIESVSETAYSSPLAQFEIDALMVHDDVFAKYYPNWTNSIVRVNKASAEILRDRLLDILRNSRRMKRARATRRQQAIRRLARGRPQPLVRYLLMDTVSYPTSYWSENLSRETEDIASQLPEFSRSLTHR